MARSTYIYVLQGIWSGNILAAFTVKHEMLAWLNRHSMYEPRNISINVFRDGGPNKDVAGTCKSLSWSRNDDGTAIVEKPH